MNEVNIIPEGWKVISLGEIIEVKHGFAFKGEFITEKINENILLTPGNFQIGGGFKSDKLKFYEGQVPEEYLLKSGDIIVTMTDLSKDGDTLGYSAKVPSDSNNYLHNQRIGLVKFRNENFSKDFIYWLLRTPHYQKCIVNSATGSTVRHTSPNRIQQYNFALPIEFNEQESISNFFNSFENKIELLKSQNKTLEEIIQTIYKEWFSKYNIGDFLPDQWRIKKLKECGNIICGKTPPKSNQNYYGNDVPFIKIPDMHNKMFIVESNDNLSLEGANSQMNKMLPKGSICVSCIATVGLVSITTKDSQTNQQINSIIPNSNILTEFCTSSN